MINHRFAEYSTSVAFFIQLSKNQCNALLRCDDMQQKGDTRYAEYLTIGTLKPLNHRGLVFWHKDKEDRNNGFGGLTEAGKLMVGLLKEAGMTIENTNTLSVLARIERESS